MGGMLKGCTSAINHAFGLSGCKFIKDVFNCYFIHDFSLKRKERDNKGMSVFNSEKSGDGCTEHITPFKFFNTTNSEIALV